MATQQKKITMSVDATRTWEDPNGNEWEVAVEFKSANGRVDFAGVVIRPTRSGYPLTRRVLAQVPMLDLFSESMFDEQINFERWRDQRKSESQHRGRALTHDELKLIAEIREIALKANFPVLRAIAMALGISEVTAGTRIKAARERGYIPPSNRTTA